MFVYYVNFIKYSEWGKVADLWVCTGATMCQLYELAGWEGGADELTEGVWMEFCW